MYLELAMAEEIKVPTVDQHGLVDFRRSEVEVFVLEKEEHFVEDGGLLVFEVTREVVMQGGEVGKQREEVRVTCDSVRIVNI